MKFTFETDNNEEAQAIIGNLVAIELANAILDQLNAIKKHYFIFIGETPRQMNENENKLFNEIFKRLTGMIQSRILIGLNIKTDGDNLSPTQS